MILILQASVSIHPASVVCIPLLQQELPIEINRGQCRVVATSSKINRGVQRYRAWRIDGWIARDWDEGFYGVGMELSLVSSVEEMALFLWILSGLLVKCIYS
jgi:hypothetical protein